MDIDRYISFLETENCNFFDHEFLPTGYNKLLDIKLYPADMFHEIINHAREKLLASKLDQQSMYNSITILNKYVDERTDPLIDYASAKRDIDNRDVFNQGALSFEYLLRRINEKYHDWYTSIQ
jgi:hypothetical protein